jgi:hypothetical protein
MASSFLINRNNFESDSVFRHFGATYAVLGQIRHQVSPAIEIISKFSENFIQNEGNGLFIGIDLNYLILMLVGVESLFSLLWGQQLGPLRLIAEFHPVPGISRDCCFIGTWAFFLDVSTRYRKEIVRTQNCLSRTVKES